MDRLRAKYTPKFSRHDHYLVEVLGASAVELSADTGARVSQFCGVLPGPVGRGDAPGMARSVILGCEEESIDGSCTTLVRVIRRCFPAAPLGF
jgi:hypothetical protein